MHWRRIFITILNFIFSLPVIISPRPGDVLKGLIVITGLVDYEAYISFDVEYSFSYDSSNTWFLITQSNLPVQNGNLATWDTATIIDGDYDLRLRVYLNDGSSQDVVIKNLRVRNYSPVETPPVVLTRIMATPTTLADASPIIESTSLQMPQNPIAVPPSRIFEGVGYGVLVVIALLLLLFLFTRIRKY